MDAATKLLPGEFGEPALDLIGPRGRCWCEAHIIVRLPRQLGFDHARFVSGVIVQDDMDIETLRNARVDLLQEVQELLSAMALVAHLPITEPEAISRAANSDVVYIRKSF